MLSGQALLCVLMVLCLRNSPLLTLRVSVQPELPSEPLQQSSRKLRLECSAAHWHCWATTGLRTRPSNTSQHSMVSMVRHWNRNQANQNQGINSDDKRPNRRRPPHRCVVIPILVPLDSDSFPTRFKGSCLQGLLRRICPLSVRSRRQTSA